MRYINKYMAYERAYKFFLLCTDVETAGDFISSIAEHGLDAKTADMIIELIEGYVKRLFTKDAKKIYQIVKDF